MKRLSSYMQRFFATCASSSKSHSAEASRPRSLMLGLLFPEVKQNWLGFSRTGNAGHGLGKDFARALHSNFSSVFRNFGEETITYSSHLEKLCLVKNGVGRDTISDFTTNLIKRFLGEYTQNFAQIYLPSALRRRVSVPKVNFNYETRSWSPQVFELPYLQGDYVLLTPKDVLTKDEAWDRST